MNATMTPWAAARPCAPLSVTLIAPFHVQYEGSGLSAAALTDVTAPPPRGAPV